MVETEGRAVSRTGMGLPVPDPPQLEQDRLPDPPQVLHPTSPSDHREQKHVTRPDPLQVVQRGNVPAMGCCWSMICWTIAAPSITLNPVAN